MTPCVLSAKNNISYVPRRWIRRGFCNGGIRTYISGPPSLRCHCSRITQLHAPHSPDAGRWIQVAILRQSLISPKLLAPILFDFHRSLRQQNLYCCYGSSSFQPGLKCAKVRTAGAVRIRCGSQCWSGCCYLRHSQYHTWSHCFRAVAVQSAPSVNLCTGWRINIFRRLDRLFRAKP